PTAHRAKGGGEAVDGSEDRSTVARVRVLAADDEIVRTVTGLPHRRLVVADDQVAASIRGGGAALAVANVDVEPREIDVAPDDRHGRIFGARRPEGTDTVVLQRRV